MVSVPVISIPVVTTILRQSAVNATGWVGTVATFGFMLGTGRHRCPIFLRRTGLPAPLAWYWAWLEKSRAWHDGWRVRDNCKWPAPDQRRSAM
jgi:hypothetical protein